ncbi:Omp28 family outer membrane lipoprotein [Bacteroidota bacterium]
MKEIRLLILAIGLLFIGSCDDIEEPFIEYSGQCGDATLPISIKQILIEEFTGHKCGYCPGGDETIELLKELYCDHVIPVSIHTGIFAQTNSSGEYTYDYNTEDGNTISEFFGPSEYPSAIINRTEYNGDLTLGQSYWTSAVSELLLQEPVMDINIALSYNSGSRNLDVDIDAVFIDAMNEKLMLSVYFIEDSIVSWQKDYSLPSGEQDVEFYTHNHVFRDAVNSAWGEEILNGQVNANDVKSKSYSYSVNTDWKIENCSIVAFVYKNDTKEVLQASQEHIMH